MNDTTDPIFKALDRLARVADTNPVGDPMPGIRRKARANRRRAAALVASGLAAVVAAGFAASSVVDFPRAAQDPGYANSPSAAVSVAPRPAPSTPPSRPGEPTLAEYDQARADVNGDGSADVIRILGAEADAADGQEETMASADVRVDVELTGSRAEMVLVLDETLVPTIVGTPDLDGDGAAELVLSFSGGDAGWLKVFTWNGENVVKAEPDPDSLSDLIDNGGLYSQEGVASSVLADDGLISWVPIGDESAPAEVRVWTWQLHGMLLVAAEAEQTQCFRPGQQYPRPC
ncbi:MAG TPA: hypothetical protein VFZ63_04805 [Jiangellaceae bacterium]